jgi:uncharacterized protein (TIGR03083 family)
MPALPAELYYAEIDASTASLAALVDYADPSLPIPTCPEWTLRQLATHLGRVQRWVTEIVTTRSATFVEFDSVPDGRLPDDRTAGGRWLTAGAARLIGALREAGDAPVWGFVSLQPASNWARRMANEAMVHGADAALAAGEEVTMVAELAADAVDEWLTVLTGPGIGRPDPRADVLPAGASLHVHATDQELAGNGEWLVTHGEDGVRVTTGHGKADVAVSGLAADLLLVLLGRRSPSDQVVQVFGDQELLDAWLAGISF